MAQNKAPKNKADLMREMEIGRKAWDAVLERVSDADMKVPGVEGFWSIRDVLAHITGYEQYAWAMLWDQHTGENRQTSALDAYYQTHLSMYRATHPNFPEQIQQVKTDQINELFAAAYQYKLPKEVRAMEREAYQKLYEMVVAYPEEQLKKQFTPNGKTLLDILPNQCYLHYYIHIPAIEKFLASKS